MTYLNECIDCGYIGDDGIWAIKSYYGIKCINEEYYVKIDQSDSFFDLNEINNEKIISKYNITKEQAEESILNGEVMCPKCRSKNYFSLLKEDL